MSLNKLLIKKRLTVLGLNSGTSADGLDLAVVRISSSRRGTKFKFTNGSKKRYSSTLKKSILSFADSKAVSLDDLIDLDNRLGRFYGRAASSLISRLSAGISIDLIASHGQTVRHLPTGKIRGSLQIGSTDFIAAATGLPVVSDFRQADIALGNEGAPITVAAMNEMFSSPYGPRLIVNIGGMSNYFYFPKAKGVFQARAADCGPGNSLCDILSAGLYSKRYDLNGRHALSGSVSEPIVKSIMSKSFYRNGTVSTGRESFGIGTAEKIIRQGKNKRLSKDDMMATVAEITVRSIVKSVRPLLKRDKLLLKLYLTGGGRFNIFFVERLMHHLPGIEVLPVDELGVSGDFVEASAYAVMGEACVRSRALPTRFTGKSGQVLTPVLGKITQPPKRKL